MMKRVRQEMLEKGREINEDGRTDHREGQNRKGEL